ncbi:hypothetical protein HY407_01240, partial [Candidatus Gottesmanbacteria bacterium]|nr:hypothetical protein [Candidatus Gottesmanbacteria bacterium]
MKKFLVLVEIVGFSQLGAGVVLAQSPLPTIIISPPANLKFVKPESIISSLIGLILIIAFLAAFLYLVLGGIKWITSGGDKAGVDAAR